MRVLVVDDSVTFRSQIKKALESISGVQVVGTASNGKIALQILQHTDVDVMTLDLNMPEMGGLEVLTRLKVSPYHHIKVIVFASRTAGSADEDRRARSLGAKDFVLKPQGEGMSLETAHQLIARELTPRIKQLINTHFYQIGDVAPAPFARSLAPMKPESSNVGHWPAKDLKLFEPRVIVVASSTGGPSALEILLSQLRPPLRVPVLIAQHMPETFTKPLAERLWALTGVKCQEAVHGELLVTGQIYVAPGNYHMRLVLDQGSIRIALDQGPKVSGVRPAADVLFESAALLYGSHCMGFVLTGMGDDGCLGAQKIKSAGGGIMIQDKVTAVVWGMPGSVHAVGAFDQMGSIKECAAILSRMCLGPA